MKPTKKFILLSEAAKNSPYSQEYLSLLARRKKIFSKKIRRNWYTTKEAIEDYLKKQQGLQVFVPGFQKPILIAVENIQSSEQDKPKSLAEEFEKLNLPEDKQETIKEFEEVPKPEEQKSKPSTPVYITNEKLNVEDKNLSEKIEDVLQEIKQGIKTNESIQSNLLTQEQKEFVDISSRSKWFKFNKFNLQARELLRDPRKATLILVGAIAFLFLFVGGFSFGQIDDTLQKVKKVFTDAETLNGHFPGTHANEVLLLDKAGNISIYGHIETQGQLRSYAEQGVAPIVVDSITKVENLNVDYLDNLDSTDFTLAFVTKNGNITYEDIFLEGGVEVGRTLLVKGATKLLNSLTIDGGNLILTTGTIKINNTQLIENLNADKLDYLDADDFTLDQVLSFGDTARRMAFFEAGVWGKDGAFGSLGVSGDVSIGNESDPDKSKFVVFSKKFKVDSNGKITTNDLVVSNTIQSNLIPSGSYDLGSTTKPWDELIVSSASFLGTLTVTGTGGGNFEGTTSSSFRINTDNATADSEDSYLSFERGTKTPNAILKWGSTNKQFNFNQPVKIASTSFEVVGTASISGDLILTGSGSAAGRLQLGRAPTTPHTGTWPSFSGLDDATLLINPSSSVADGNLIAVTIGGAAKFVVDAEGDIFSDGNLVLTGTTTQSTTNITGDLLVEGNTRLGDASSDRIKLVGTILPNATTTASIITVQASPSWTGDYYTRWLDSSSNPIAVIASTGNVGIGTTVPGARLDIREDSTNNLAWGTTSSILAYLTSSGGNPVIRSVSGQPLRLQVNGGTDAIYMKSDGNVGIGNTSPDSKLDVTGNILASSSGNVDFILRSSTTNGASNNDDAKFTFRTGSASERFDIVNGAGTKLVTIASKGNIITLVDDADLRWGGFLAATNPAVVNQPRIADVGNGFLSIWTIWSGTEAADIELQGNGPTIFRGCRVTTGCDTTSQFIFDTKFNFDGASAGGRLISFKHLGAEKSYIDKDGGIKIGDDLTITNQLQIANSGATVSYSRFGTGTTTKNYISQANDLLVSGDLEVLGTISGAFIIPGSSSGNFDPKIDNTYELGDPTYRWKKINVGPGSIDITSTTGTSGAGTNYTLGQIGFTGSSLSFGTFNQGTGSRGTLEFKTASTSRMFISSSGNVGIGTTGPGDKLQVSAANSKGITIDAPITPVLTIKRTNDLTGTGNINWIGSDDAVDWRIGVNDTVANSFAIKEGTTDASTRLFIATGGNVGIGTTGPTTKLDIIGNASVSQDFEIGGNLIVSGDLRGGTSISGNFDPATDNTYELGDTTYRWKKINLGPTSLDITSTTSTGGAGTNYTLGQIGFTGSSLSFGTFNQGTGSRGTLEFKTASTSRMFISGTGNVGIGTTGPNAKLHVVGGDIAIGDLSTDRHIRIADSAGNLDRVLLRQSTTNDIYFGDIDDNDGDIFFRTDGIERMTITGGVSGGNVGIGTTVPGAKLEIKSDGTTSQTLFRARKSDGVQAGEFVTDASARPELRISDAGGSTQIVLGVANSYFNAGNVGIGTTGPGAKLDVAGSLLVRGDSSNATFTDPGQIAFKRSDGNPFLSFHADDGTRRAYIQSIGIDRLAIADTAGTEVLTLKSGNVGIGTTGPNAKLEVSLGASTGEIARFSAGSNSRGKITGDGTNTTFEGLSGNNLQFGTSGSGIGITMLNLNNNVGIGTANLTEKLEVVGAASISSTGRFGSTLTVAGGGITVTGNSTIAGTLSSLTGLSSSGTITLSGLTASRVIATDASSNLTASFVSSVLASSLTDETGSGAAVFAASPTLSGTINFPGSGVWNSSGNVGVGTAPSDPLDVRHSDNSASADNIALSVTNTNTGSSTWRLINAFSGGYQTDSEFIVYGDGGVTADGSFTSPADFAEYFHTDDTSLNREELVCFDDANDKKIIRCAGNDAGKLLGVISTKPGFVGTPGGDVTDDAITYKNDPHWKIVGLMGQVPTRVSLENGLIRAGDKLTTSSTPGVAMKATEAGMVIGTAMESINTIASGSYVKITVFVSPSYWAPSTEAVALQSQETITVSSSGTGVTQVVSGTTDVLGTLADAVLIKVQSLWASGDIIAEGIKKTYYSVASAFDWEFDLATMASGWLTREITISQNADDETRSLFSGQGAQAANQSRVDLAENGNYLATYGVDSTRGEIVLSGTSKLEFGEAKIYFDFSFSSVISDKVSLKVLVTPVTDTIRGQLVVINKTPFGFVVTELNAKSSGEFDWLVIARRKGYEGTDIGVTPTPSPSVEPSPAPAESPTSSLEPTPSPTPLPSPEPSPSESPTPSPSPEPTPTPSSEPTPTISSEPSLTEPAPDSTASGSVMP